MSGRRASSKWSRDLALSKLEEKAKELEKSRQHFQNEINRIDQSLQQIRVEYAKIYNESSMLLNLPTEVLCMILELASSAHPLEKNHKEESETGDDWDQEIDEDEELEIDEDEELEVDEDEDDDPETDDDNDPETDNDDDLETDDKDPNPDSDEKSLLPEVVISQVCKHLRDVALNYPPLWTRFFFFLNNVESGMSNTLTRFDTYIKRSRSQNLELYLDFKEARAGRPPLEERSKLLDAAIQHIHRWKIVTLISDGYLCVEEQFPTLIVASAPNLEYLCYSPWSMDAVFLSEHVITGLEPGLLQGGTPKLRYLLLDSSSFRLPAFLTVTTLRIEIDEMDPSTLYSWDGFLAVLSLPLLTNLSICGDIFHGPDSNHVPVVAMNNLKHLRYSHTPCMTRILPFLRPPLLETLLIKQHHQEPENELGNIDKSYFFPSLRSLVLWSTHYGNSYSACRIMQLSKNIDRLTISDTGNFFNALLSTHGSFNNDECWPKLSSIILRWWDPEKDEFESFCDFFSRPKGTLKLWLLKQLHNSCESTFPVPYRLLREHCIVQLLESEKEMLPKKPSWPPGVNYPDYALRDDPFPEFQVAF